MIADESLTRLLSSLAHELRNPLNGARLHISFLERALRRSHPDPELLEAVEVVQGDIARLARVVTEFLECASAHPPEALVSSDDEELGPPVKERP